MGWLELGPTHSDGANTTGGTDRREMDRENDSSRPDDSSCGLRGSKNPFHFFRLILVTSNFFFLNFGIY